MKPPSEQRVLVVGAGGLGCPASLALGQGGVGGVTLVDGDRVELTNLHRQLWHREEDLGALKAESAGRKLAMAFPGLALKTLGIRVDVSNVDALFRAHDWVVDGTDSARSKFLLSDAAVRTGIPLVFGGVLRWSGQAMFISRAGPCLRCLYDDGSLEEGPSCASVGVLGSMAGMVGGLQVLLGKKGLAGGAGSLGQGTLVRVDGLNLQTRHSTVERNPECPVCAWPAPSLTADITAELCPMTYVRTKLKLDALKAGQVLEVVLRGEEPLRNVPRSAREEGHQVLSVDPGPNGSWRVCIRKQQSKET